MKKRIHIAGSPVLSASLATVFAAVVMLIGPTATAQSIRLASSPGIFYGDDKQGNGILNNYEAYLISNNTAVTLPSVYVALTNIAPTNVIRFATNETHIRSLGALAPGQTILAAFYMRGPSLTGSDQAINENHIIQVLDGPPGQGGSVLVSTNSRYTNCVYVQEASANKVVIITNLNPRAVLGAVVPLVIGGNSGTVSSPPLMVFSPAVFDNWRPDAYNLEGCSIQFDSLPTYTNTLYLDNTLPGFSPASGGNLYTNTFYFRARKVTGTNVPVSPFGFIASGNIMKHTALSSLTALGPTNSVIVSVTNAVVLNHTVTPTNLLAAYGATVTYNIVISNTSSADITLDQIVDTLPGYPDNATFVPNSATYNSLALTNPFISGQTLTWNMPFAVGPNTNSVLTFQAYAPYVGGRYTNTVVGIIGGETIGTSLDTSTNSASQSVFTVVPITDVAAFKSGPSTVYAGTNFNYTLTITNLGPSPTTGLSVTDAVPAGLTYVTSAPPATLSGGVLIWTNLAQILGGTETNLTVTFRAGAVSATYTNIVRAGNTTQDPNSTNNTSSPVVTTNVEVADLGIIKTGPATSISPFANFNYNLLVTNAGASIAGNVTVTDNIPAQVTFVSASAGGTINAGKVVWNLGNLPALFSTNLTLTVKSPAHGTVTNTASAATTTLDIVTNNNTTPNVTTTVSNVPPVAVNDSSNTLPNTAVTIPVLANDSDANGDPLTIVSVTQTNGTAIISGTNVVFTPATNFTGNVVLTYTITDGFGGTNSAQIFITVSTLADLFITKSAATNIYSGGSLTYTISVTNLGPATASSITVTDAVPSGATFVSASSGGLESSGVVTWALGDFAKDQFTNLTLTVTAPASGTLTNIARVGSPTGDSNPTNNVTPPVTTTVTASADLGLGKAAAASVLAGNNLIYTLSVTNLGPNTASNVVITDPLPPGAGFVSASGGGSENSGSVTWNLGSLTNGQVNTLTLTVAAPASGTLTNSASVTSPTSDPNPTNNITLPVVTTVTPLADLAIGKTGPAMAVFGNNFSYTISVTNFGPSTAGGILVTDTLPANLVFVGATPSANTNAANEVIWSLAGLVSGASTNLSLTVNSISIGAPANTATVGSPTSDPNPTNNVTPPVVTAVGQASSQATWTNPPSIVYGTPLGTNQNNAIANVGGTFTYNPTNGTVLPVGTNTLTVLFTPDNTNYASTNLSVQLVVTPAPLTITANNQGKVYGAALNMGTSAFNSSGLVNGETIGSVTLASTGAATNAAAGTYAIVPSAATGGTFNPANYSITYSNGTLTVNAATLTVAANSTNKVYGTVNPAFTASYSGFLNGDTSGVLSGSPSLTTTATTNSGVGSYTIVATNGTLSAANYVFSFVNGTLSVNAATLTVTANSTNKIYGATNPAFTASYSGFANGETPSVLTGSPSLTSSATTNSGVGSYPIAATNGTLSAANYVFSFVNGTLTVNAAKLTVTANNTNRLYNVANPTFTASYSGFVNGETSSVLSGSPSLTTTAILSSPAGTYPINATNGTLSAANYAFSFVNGTLTIAGGAFGITWTNPASIVYGTPLGTNQNNASATTGGSYVYNPTNGTLLPAGTNLLSVVFTPTDTNYPATNASVQLVVTPAPLTITASNATRLYGQANPAFGGSVTGIQNGDNITATYASSATTNSPVGAYPIVPALSDPNSRLMNYVVTTNNGTLTVSKAVLVVTANSTNKAYGAANPAFTASYSGFVNGDTSSVLSGSPSFTTAATTNSGVGNYTITATNGTLSAANYVFSFVNGTLTIDQAGLSVTASDQVKNYGTTLTLGAGQTAFTSSGLQNGETIGSVTLTASGGTAANDATGTYTITPSAATGGTFNLANYNVSYFNGSLIVTQSVSADLAVSKTGPASAVAGSNMVYSITVTNLGPSAATNVVVKDWLPTGYSFVSATPTATFASNVVTWSVFKLAANAKTNFTVTVRSLEGGTFTNTATATSDAYDPNSGNSDGSSTNSQARTVVSPRADVAVIKTGGTNAYAGGMASYTITVTNLGPSTASNVVVMDRIPTNTTFLSASGSYSISSNVLSWDALTLTNGATASFTISLKAPATGSFTNIALSTAATADPNSTNNNGTATGSRVVTKTVPSADVVVLVSGPPTATQGSNFVYNITVTNGGPSVSSNIVVSDNLPIGLTFVSASGNGKRTNSIVTWPPIKSLAVGGVTNYTITVNASLLGAFTNSASALAVTYDPDPTNNSGVTPASRAVTEIGVAQFSILAGTPVFNPQTGLYEETVTVTNNAATTILGFRLHVGGLTNNVTLYNASGVTNGAPFVNYNYPVDPSNAVSLILQFYNPTRQAFTHSLWAEAILPTATSVMSTNGAAEARILRDPRTDRVFIEFLSVPDKTYTILYSSDLTAPVWKVATPSVHAAANVTQWYDDGPPVTDSKPTIRFYRVIQFD